MKQKDKQKKFIELPYETHRIIGMDNMGNLYYFDETVVINPRRKGILKNVYLTK